MKQGINELLNLIMILKGVMANETELREMPVTKLNGTNSDYTAPENGLFIIRVKAKDFIGDIEFLLQERTVLRLEASANIDSGDVIYLICDAFSTIAIAENSGDITIEGFEYTPPIN